MIDENTTATTAEICLVVGFTKQRLGQLESQGVVTRAGRDAWPLASTVRALITDARARSDAHSASRARLDDLRASREKLKLLKECREVVYTREFDEFGLAVYAAHVRHYGPLAARIGGRDLAVRQRAEKELMAAQQGLSDELKRLGEAIKDGESRNVSLPKI
jgi:hypothetical protein